MDLSSIASTIELVRLLGFSAVVFIIWIVTVQFFKHILREQKDLLISLLNKQDGQYRAIFEEQSRRNTENFQVLNKFAESIDYIAGQVSTTNSKIENNHYCPIVRKENKE